ARMNVEFLSEAAKSERLQARQAERCEMIRQFYKWVLAEARNRGDLRADIDPDAAAELLMALNEGIVLLSVAGLRAGSLDSLKTAYVLFVNAALGASGHSPFIAEPILPAAMRNGTHHSGGLH